MSNKTEEIVKGILCPRERYIHHVRGMWPRGGRSFVFCVAGWLAGWSKGQKYLYREIGERRWKVKCEAKEEHIQARGREDVEQGIYRLMAEKEDEEEMGLRGGGRRRKEEIRGEE
ncbi:hypothetical protein Pcinc_012618 [Petrolisthes cinctipes]|uniref:Uncharacterized protein n=1 Tax=Petrolisthes cinctipes TaxID=88211 RepID=A0AAE1KTA2_PETCI|nr:hypothetical protein Pcinc_012618 [Petrolisthes cinctipes]